ncbi:MAG: hypothetical protein JXQ73_16065 [Phycisphaerae bacterium]|nr:hypothetical protein [Phycisphaerae bacterium]
MTTLTIACLLCGLTPTETLHNGIELPKDWPPKLKTLTMEPTDPPYLQHPPKVIPIDVGRQLFVDYFLIQQTTLKRTMHTATYHPASPVLIADKPWEKAGKWKDYVGPHAIPFSDGVWYDPKDKLFKMWYMAGTLYATAYATSKDGIHWEKPDLDVVPGTNIVHPGNRDSCTIWLDLEEKDPQRRYKMFRFQKIPRRGLVIQFSADGIHWGKEVRWAGPCNDRSTVYCDPFRKVWVYSLKAVGPVHGGPAEERIRRYWEQNDLIKSPMWSKMDSSLLWTSTDRLDPTWPKPDIGPPKIYNLDAVAYESVLLGAFSILQTYYKGERTDRPKRNQVCLGFSRDGWHWSRPMRTPFIPCSERRSDWNWGNIQSAGGVCLIVSDKIYFYVSGRAGSARLGEGKCHRGADASTGLAVLRRDGFASMDAGESEGTLTTRALRFQGRHLFVNAKTDAGELRVEALDEDGNVLEPFTRQNCEPVRADGTLLPVRWRGVKDLSAAAGKPVRLRFHLSVGSLYAFWVSPDESGASHGYVAAGGPGFTGPIDTVGKGIHRSATDPTSSGQ